MSEDNSCVGESFKFRYLKNEHIEKSEGYKNVKNECRKKREIKYPRKHKINLNSTEEEIN